MPTNPVQVWLPLVVVVRVAFAPDRLAQFVADEPERSAAHDVLLVPARVFVDDVLFVNDGIWIGERRQECQRRELQVEHHGRRIGRADCIDHVVPGLARAGVAFWRVDDLIPACRHIGGRERRTVMEFHALADLECVGGAVVRRLRHVGAEVADEARGVLGMARIEADQHTVERRHRMHGDIGGLAMRIEARRRIGRDHVGENAAALRRFIG